MGACNFYHRITPTKGETMDKAFSRAHEDAAWESGHGGYTGTLAEKYGYVKVDLPKGKDAHWLEKAISDWLSIGWDNQPEWTADRVAYERAEREAERIVRQRQDTESELANTFGARKAREIAEAWHDKWGPAIGCKDTDGDFVFTGMASS